ncbi:hypothetical protein Sru01_20980 [Sphaerisporangium rufum]|uniref:Zinc-ribbon 15 domain-containing protein n=1 Tax=Sphaerisporangium rufum TaxID=1381558 RepID=A0A919R2B8_9ACTN|nr:zinc ribbon domain-containing protein [Sphaerisporangium rufum]GII77116.1 hypothetical protein Sru01_20980 [Sphaerisporangium rufum]
MFILFGLRTLVHRLGAVTATCRNCGNTAAQMVTRNVTKFSLFFVPLFPVRTRYAAQCTYCGAAYGISREEAERLPLR